MSGVTIESLVISRPFALQVGGVGGHTRKRTAEIHKDAILYFFDEPERSMAKNLCERVYLDGCEVLDAGTHPDKGECLALFLIAHDYGERVDSFGKRQGYLFDQPKGARQERRGGADYMLLLYTTDKMSKWLFLRALLAVSQTAREQQQQHEELPAFAAPHNHFASLVGSGRGGQRPRASASRSSSSSAVTVLSDHEVLRLEDVLPGLTAGPQSPPPPTEDTRLASATLEEEEDCLEAPCGGAPETAAGAGEGAAAAAAATGDDDDVDSRIRRSALYERCLRGRPDNLVCCDCGAPRPTWGVLRPFGCFVCIRCVGVHRSLWANRCREVELDEWPPEDVDFVAGRGNAAVNTELEFCVRYPPRSVEAIAGGTARKPVERSGQQVREAYIRHKYVERLFTREMHPEAVAGETGDAAATSPPRDVPEHSASSPAGSPVFAPPSPQPGGGVVSGIARAVGSAVGGGHDGDDGASGPPRYSGLVDFIVKELSGPAAMVGATCVLSNGFQELRTRPSRKLLGADTATVWDEALQLGVERGDSALYCAVRGARHELLAVGRFTLPRDVLEGAGAMLEVELPYYCLNKKIPSHEPPQRWRVTALVTYRLLG